jgi:hypothetical protein
MKRKFSLAISGCAASLLGAVEAKEVPFNGFEAALAAGYKLGSNATMTDDLGVQAINTKGPLLGIHLGYSWEFQKLVLGWGVSYMKSWTSGKAERAMVGTSQNYKLNGRRQLFTGPQIGVRLGQFMPFFQGGFAQTRYRWTLARFERGGDDTFDYSKTANGHFWGGGLKMRTEKLVFALSLNFVRYRSHTLAGLSRLGRPRTENVTFATDRVAMVTIGNQF